MMMYSIILILCAKKWTPAATGDGGNALFFARMHFICCRLGSVFVRLFLFRLDSFPDYTVPAAFESIVVHIKHTTWRNTRVINMFSIIPICIFASPLARSLGPLGPFSGTCAYRIINYYYYCYERVRALRRATVDVDYLLALMREQWARGRHEYLMQQYNVIVVQLQFHGKNIFHLYRNHKSSHVSMFHLCTAAAAVIAALFCVLPCSIHYANNPPSSDCINESPMRISLWHAHYYYRIFVPYMKDSVLARARGVIALWYCAKTDNKRSRSTTNAAATAASAEQTNRFSFVVFVKHAPRFLFTSNSIRLFFFNHLFSFRFAMYVFLVVVCCCLFFSLSFYFCRLCRFRFVLLFFWNEIYYLIKNDFLYFI